MVDTSIEVVLGMPSFILSDADIWVEEASLEELHNAEAILFGRHQEG